MRPGRRDWLAPESAEAAALESVKTENPADTRLSARDRYGVKKAMPALVLILLLLALVLAALVLIPFFIAPMREIDDPDSRDELARYGLTCTQIVTGPRWRVEDRLPDETEEPHASAHEYFG